jgi:DNA-directed RNA polymerase subunit H
MVSKAKTPKKEAKEAKKKVAKKSKTTTKKKAEKPVKKDLEAKKESSKKKPSKKEVEDKPVKKPIFEHILVPKHRLMTDDEKSELLKKYKIGLNQLPKISSNDPVMKLIKDFKPGDILEIERESITAGKTKYYRVVKND